jgi:hypothetical protein
MIVSVSLRGVLLTLFSFCCLMSSSWLTAQDATVDFNTTIDLSVIEDPEDLGEILQQPNALFGNRLAVSGERIIGSAYPASTRGHVYVFGDSGLGLSVEGALHDAMGFFEEVEKEGFGVEVAIAGEQAAVLQRKRPNPAVGVHLFSGGFFGWFNDQTLYPHTPTTPVTSRDWPDGDVGGVTTLAMSEDTLLLGCPEGMHPKTGVRCGIVGVFTNTTGYWEHVLTLVPSEPKNGMNFGAAVAVHKDTIAVGAPGTQVDRVFLRGATFVFTRQAEDVTPAWKQTARLTDPRGKLSDRLGTAVAVADNVIIASSPGKDHGGQGAVLGFAFSGGKWVDNGVFPTPPQELSPAFAGSPRFFGAKLSMAGSMASVLSTAGPADEERSYLFHRRGGRWIEIKPPATGVNETNAISNATAVGGNKWIVGRPSVNTDAGLKSGEIRIYDISAGFAVYDGPTVFSPEVTEPGGTYLDVGDLVAGKSYKRSFTIQNLSTETLTVVGIDVLGFENEVVTGGEGLEELLPNASVTLTLSYKPAEEGFWQAEINLDTFGTNFERTTISLSAVVVVDGEPAFAVLNAPPSTLARYEDFLELESIPFGTQSINFNWTRNGVTVPGNNQRLLRIPTMTPALVGTYKLNVSNLFGSSSTASTAVAMYYERPPTALQLVNAKTARIVAPVVGPGVTYRWYFNNNPLSDGTDYSGTSKGTLNIKKVTTGMAGQYYCILNPGPRQVIPQRWNTSVLQLPVITNPANFLSNLSVTQPLFTRFETDFPAKQFHITGKLPPGLVLNTLTGVISGQPTAPGMYSITASASNAAGFSPPLQVRTFTILVGGMIPMDLQRLIGSYSGIVARHSTNNLLGGSVNLSVSGFGAVTGSLKLATKVVRFSGQLATAGGGIYQVEVIVQEGLTRDIYLIKIDPAARRMFGTVAFGSQQVLAEVFSGWKKMWNTVSPSTAWLDTYTIALTPSVVPPDVTSYPSGTSYARAVVDAEGNVSITGQVADGTSYTASAYLSPPLGTVGADFVEVPIHVLVNANVGCLNGTLTISQSNSALAGFHSAGGSLTWFKRPVPTSRSYKAGIAAHTLAATGGRYVPPAGVPMINIPSRATPNATLEVSGASIATSAQFAQIANGFNVSNTNVSTFSVPNTLKHLLTIDAAKGTFTGSFVLRDANPTSTTGGQLDRTVKYSGVILSGLNQAVGYFTLANLPTVSPPTTSTTSPIFGGSLKLKALP